MIEFLHTMNSYAQALKSSCDAWTQSLKDKLEKKNSEIDIFNSSGEQLDSFGNNFGLVRHSIEKELTIVNIISLTAKEPLSSNIIIPVNTKFYVASGIYIETTTVYNMVVGATELVVSGVLNVNKLNAPIPPKTIVQVESQLANITVLFDIESLRTLGSSTDNETDDMFRNRIIHLLKNKGDNTHDRLISCILSSGITSYKIIDPTRDEGKVMVGYVVIVISPPEVDRFKSYKTLLESYLSEVLKYQKLFVEVKEPAYVYITVKNWNEEKRNELEEYINTSVLGDTIIYTKLMEYGGSSATFNVGNRVLNNDLKLTNYQKARIEFLN